MSNVYKLKEKVQSNTQLTFWWKSKSSSYEIYLRGLYLCYVLLRTRSAQRLNLQDLSSVPTPNIAELVLLFCPQPWFLQRSEHIFPGKTPCMFMSIDKCYCSWRSLMVIAHTYETMVRGLILRGKDKFCLFCQRLPWEYFQKFISTSEKKCEAPLLGLTKSI